MSGLDDEEEGDLEGIEDDASADERTDEIEDEFEEEIGDELEEEEGGDFDADEDLKVVDEALSHKDQNARALAIRRAIEERLEAKRLSRDLDYLDLDLDSED